MKKLLILLAAMTLVFGAVSQAGAAVKFGATGNWQHQFTYQHNVPNFNSDLEQDNLFMYNRANITFTVEANEYIKANTLVRIGAFDWGNGHSVQPTAAATNAYGGTMASRTGLEVRQAFISVKFPGVPVTLDTGVMPLALPAAALGSNPVLNDRLPAIVLGFPVGDVGKAALVYSRPYRTAPGTSKDFAKYNSIDAIAALADLNFGNFGLAPYLAYVKAGHKATITGGSGVNRGYYTLYNDDNNTTAIIGGAAFKISPVENLSIGLDAIYGATSSSDSKNDTTLPIPAADGSKDVKASGFLVGLSVDYKMDFGTPGAFCWYGSGLKKSDTDDGKYGVLPLIGPDGGIQKMRFATHSPRVVTATDSQVAGRNGVGTMGIGVQLANVKSMDKLTHTFRLGYIKGTGDKDANYLTNSGGYNRAGTLSGNNGGLADLNGMSKDYSLIEFDIENTFKIVDNLELKADFGILAPNVKNKDDHKVSAPANALKNNGDLATDTGFALDLVLQYNF